MMEGRPPEEGLDLKGLFGVEILDAEAVTARRDELAHTIEEAQAELEEIVERRDAAAVAPDAGPVSADAGVDGDIEEPPAQALTDEEQMRLTRLELQLELDRLRLDFLTLPATTRLMAVAAADPSRRELAEELLSAATAQAEAEEAGRLAEADRRAALEIATSAAAEAVRQLSAERARVEALRAV
jgi:hypothetical protein